MEFLTDFVTYIKSLNEGLITTYDIKKTVIDLDNMLDRNNIKHKTKITDNTFVLLLPNFNTIKNVDNIIKIILSQTFNMYGWFACNMKLVYLSGKEYSGKFNENNLILSAEHLDKVYIKFESKFDEIKNVPNKLYHLSIQQYENDIIKNGLLPKSKSKLSAHDYDGRIYLCETPNQCISLIPQMEEFYSREKYDILTHPRNPKKIYNKNTKWIIFEIDTKLANIKVLYKDPNYINGYYYLDVIPPKTITIASINGSSCKE